MATPKQLKRRHALGLALLAGGCFALSFPTVSWWPLAWLGFTPLLFALRGRSVWGGLGLGWLTGTVTSLYGLSWVGDLLAVFAHLPWYLAGLGLLISSIAHGLPFAVTGALTCWLWRNGVRPIVAVPLAITAAELVVPLVFPWLLAVSQQDLLVLLQIADLLGAQGISTVVALGGAVLFELLQRPRERRLGRAAATAAAIIGLVLLYGSLRLHQIGDRRDRAPALRIGLVQPNLSIEEKHDRQRRPINLALHQDMTAELERRGAELVIWPESSYPFYIRRPMSRDLRGPAAVRSGFTGPVIFGAGSVDGRRRRYNSAFLLEADGRLVGPADKNELLIFGEYIPFFDDFEWLQRAFPQTWNWSAGEQPGLLAGGPLRAGILNCYEDVLPRYVRRLVAERRPNLLVNITNDAWFGDTAQPHQHAAAARFRAIEHRLDLVRAVNSGVSNVVAATGEVVDETEVSVRTTVLADVRLMQSERTIYGRLGKSWAWIVVLAMPALVFWQRRRWRESEGDQ